MHRTIAFLLSVLLSVFNPNECPAQSWQPGPAAGWRFRFRSEANAVRILEVAPDQWTKPKRRLIVFATPNGNTLEQSYGAIAKEGRDWHFDIQHIGAQFRYAQLHSPEVDLALVILQPGQLSWPAFRQTTDGADKQIRRLIESLQTDFGPDETYLTCHSGGGSLIWGWMNAYEQLPSSVTRIALLDANYSYDDKLRHGDKLLEWIKSTPTARLLVMAYDDRQVEYQGKRVVSDDGGTYRASKRMIDRFKQDSPSERATLADRQSITFVDERIQILDHPNPQNKILHTALVGELNGFAYACLWGHEPQAVELLTGPRCYDDWITEEPVQDPTRSQARSVADAPSRMLNLPPRPAAAESGSAFIERIAKLDRQAREQAIATAVLSGNVPNWSRTFIPIEVLDSTAGNPRSIQLHVLQDYLAIGADDDAVRMPMTPATAWQICEQLDCSLPTAKLCDALFAAAHIRLTPHPMRQDRDQVLTFLEHDRLIEKQLLGKARDCLVIGHKKDVILSNALLKREHRVAIYGWHYPSGVPIQPIYSGHVDWYTDYSHGIRLIANPAMAGGQDADYRSLLHSEGWQELLSNEGRIDVDQLKKN